MKLRMSQAPHKTTETKEITLSVVVSFLGTAAFIWWLDGSYLPKCPRSPNPLTGQIHLYNDHGTIVYLSRAQEIAAYSGGLAFLTMICVCILVIVTKTFIVALRPPRH